MFFLNSKHEFDKNIFPSSKAGKFILLHAIARILLHLYL